MRKSVSTLVLGLGLVLAFGCDVEEAPPPAEERECIMGWTETPCLDVLEAAKAARCEHVAFWSWESLPDDDYERASQEAETACVLAVAHLRGLTNNTQLVLDAWRSPGGSAYTECAAMDDAGLAGGCQFPAEYTTYDDCLESDEIRRSGLYYEGSADPSARGAEMACKVLAGGCEQVESGGSTYLDCELPEGSTCYNNDECASDNCDGYLFTCQA